MAQFKDNVGREYTVAIDGYVLHRARTNGKLSLSGLFEQAQKTESGGGGMPDPAMMLELCFYGCEHCSRIRAGKVTKEDFLRALTGQALLDALTATAEALSVCLRPAGAEADASDADDAGDRPLAQAEAKG
jgi:hypothetical protein